jgi:osmotically-inducible protein OsmY
MRFERTRLAAESRDRGQRHRAAQRHRADPPLGSAAIRLRALRGAAVGLAALFVSTAAVADRDDEVSARARQALVSAALPGAGEISVTSFNGEVELSGTARSEHIREEAARVVAAVRGVTAVRNSLGTRPPSGERDADDVLSDQVRTALAAAGIPDARNISVKAFNGSVELAGIVGSDDSRLAATRAAGQVRGVSALRDSLVVRHP